MHQPHVFISRLIADDAIALVRDVCVPDIWREDMPPERDELMRRSQNADGIITLLTDRIDETFLARCPRLKVISNMAAGVDNVDVQAATARQIPVGHTPGVLTEATADMTFALLLAAARRIIEARDYVEAGRWKTWGPQTLLGLDLGGASLGIIGYGRIGRAVARRASGFGMQVAFYDPGEVAVDGAQAMPVDRLLGWADFVTLHVPLTQKTRHLINADTLRLMRRDAVLVNTSRGPVVDHEALYDALREKRLFAAALDVTEPEPLPQGHPLLGLENCIVVPHIGSASRTARREMALMAARNLLAGLRGERLPTCANPEVYRAGGVG